MRKIFEALAGSDPVLPACEYQTLKPVAGAAAEAPSSFVGSWEQSKVTHSPETSAVAKLTKLTIYPPQTKVDPSRVDVVYGTSGSGVEFSHQILADMRRRPGYRSLVRMAASSSGVGKEDT